MTEQRGEYQDMSAQQQSDARWAVLGCLRCVRTIGENDPGQEWPRLVALHAEHGDR